MITRAHLPRPQRNPGFTLLEMLVTLVIVSLVGALLSQALYQLGRVEQLMSGGQLRSMAESLRVEWVRDALTGLLPGEPSTAERFKGDATQLSGVSTAVPRFPVAGLGPLHLALRFDAEQGRTELVFSVPPTTRAIDAGAPQPLAVLLSWPGQAGRLRYQADDGSWHDSWPPSMGSQTTKALPALIAVETGLPEMAQLFAAPRAADLQQPNRRTMESM